MVMAQWLFASCAMFFVVGKWLSKAYEVGEGCRACYLMVINYVSQYLSLAGINDQCEFWYLRTYLSASIQLRKIVIQFVVVSVNTNLLIKRTMPDYIIQSTCIAYTELTIPSILILLCSTRAISE